MKYAANKSLSKFILILLSVLYLSSFVCSRRELYPKKGEDWPGICNIGKFQSPVNIIDKKNTVDDSIYKYFTQLPYYPSITKFQMMVFIRSLYLMERDYILI